MTLNLASYIETQILAPALPEPDARLFAANLQDITGMEIYPRSVTASMRSLFFLCRQGERKQLGIISGNAELLRDFAGDITPITIATADHMLLIGPLTAANAAALRRVLVFLVPRPLGLAKSAGCGDRLGLATPGHVRAIRHSTMAPIFAQQSMRENARTGRTPQQVMDEALWGVFQEGWRDGFGSDADHLKTTADIDLCAAAGFTFYTFDPGEHVDNRANAATPGVLQGMAETLPWDRLETNLNDLMKRLAEREIDLGTLKTTLTQEDVLRAAAKYGKAVAHTAAMYCHLASVMAGRAFELEMSVDETETVTSLAEHIYIAFELKKLGVRWVSLAPRYVGSFEKGVDYIGDLAAFERSFAQHIAVAKALGPYKLSLHSGSDKFSIYPIAARLAGELVHLKTAGTSYLEALRAIASIDPGLFREIMALAIRRYPVDRASYHVSARTEEVPDIAHEPDAQLSCLLDHFHVRQILHVTFGSLLQEQALRRRFFSTLQQHEEIHYQMLETHFGKHLAPFTASRVKG